MTREQEARLAWIEAFERQRRDRDDVRTEYDGEGTVTALGYPRCHREGGPREARAERSLRYGL